MAKIEWTHLNDSVPNWSDLSIEERERRLRHVVEALTMQIRDMGDILNELINHHHTATGEILRPIKLKKYEDVFRTPEFPDHYLY
jgi:hypothetical protein